VLKHPDVFRQPKLTGGTVPESRPDRIATFGFLTLAVTDLELAVDFYARIARLEPTESRGDTVFMSGGREHHWLRLERSEEPGVRRVSFEATGPGALEELAEVLRARGIATESDAGFAVDRVGSSLRFEDPSGVPVEVYTGLAELPVPVAENGVRLREMLHTLWLVPDIEQAVEFWTNVMGFKVSDRLETQVAFLRCGDGYHHSFAIGQGPPKLTKATFAHFCVLVDHIDDVMRFRHNAVAHGLSLEHDLLRHPTSGSMGVYVKEPIHGFSVEFCVNHQRLDDSWTARQLTAGPAMIDVWKEPLPPPRVNSKAAFNVVLAAREAEGHSQ
jgi:catechol 2,3-dioxygenase-like lactoylglutathione lyase family enzyme